MKEKVILEKPYAGNPHVRVDEGADALAKALTRAKKAHADAVMLVGVFTGHIHSLMVGQTGNALLFSVPSNRDGSCMEVRLSPP